MSIKSTHYVTRDFAIKAILKKIETANDEQLGDMLEVAIHNGFYNFIVISEYELEQEKQNKYGCRYLDDVNSLPDYNDAY